MKLLLDENISSRLVKFLTKDFPESSHIDYLKMQGTTDTNIWEYAQNEDFIIVSKDNDFRQPTSSKKYSGNTTILSGSNSRFACFRVN